MLPNSTAKLRVDKELLRLNVNLPWDRMQGGNGLPKTSRGSNCSGVDTGDPRWVAPLCVKQLHTREAVVVIMKVEVNVIMCPALVTVGMVRQRDKDIV